MIPSNTRYLLTAVGIHAAAVGVLLFAPASSSHTVQDVPSPILEIIPDNLRLTDGNTIGGGNPDAQPPKSSAQPPAPPAPAPPEPPQPEPPKTQPQTRPPEPAKAVELTKVEPPKKSLAAEIQRNELNVPKAQLNVPKAQDVDPSLSTKKLKSPKTDFQLAEAPKKRPKKEAEAERNNSAAAAAAQEARETREHQARVTAAREAWNRAQQARADAVRGVASNLGKNLSGSTSFEMPGPGGAAYAPYGSYLMAFYKLRWKKPTTLNVEHGEVEVEITVQRNGRVSAFKMVKPSGIRALDDSVREVLDGNRDLRPLPDGTTDSERRITIRFDLSAASPA
jgi:colicin import membrane protein